MATKEKRCEFRITVEEDALLHEAAAQAHTTVSGFVLQSALERAQTLLFSRRNLVLSPEAYDQFLAELDRPSEYIPELDKLFSRPQRIKGV
jgi:Uncharacterized protein conserved in bacteria